MALLRCQCGRAVTNRDTYGIPLYRYTGSSGVQCNTRVFHYGLALDMIVGISCLLFGFVTHMAVVRFVMDVLTVVRIGHCVLLLMFLFFLI